MPFMRVILLATPQFCDSHFFLFLSDIWFECSFRLKLQPIRNIAFKNRIISHHGQRSRIAAPRGFSYPSEGSIVLASR